MVFQLLAPVALLAGPMSAPAPADSFRATIVNRVALDIAAPARTIWSYLPGNRIRPNVERVSLNGLLDQIGARFDMIYRDSAGTVTRHDRLDVLVWEPGVRYVARVSYLPPAAPTDIVYNVELRESGGITHFVMDSYSALSLPGGGTEADRVASQVAAQKSAQEFVVTAYTRLKAEIEAAAGAQGAIVPVEREPSHETVFKNRYLQAFRVRLAPGQASLMHVHSRDDAAVRLSTATTTSQSPGEPEGPPASVVPGTVSVRSNERTPTTHRVRNVGTTGFDVMDVQALERPNGPEGPPVVSPAAENPRMRVYRFELEPGGHSTEHHHTRPYLLVAVTGMSLETTEPGGAIRRARLEVGAFQWTETGATHTLGNGGNQKGILVEIELR